MQSGYLTRVNVTKLTDARILVLMGITLLVFGCTKTVNGCDIKPNARCGGASLRDADLNAADLSGAVLNRAVLRDADLTDADLSSAILWNADLRGADLSGADLSGADLSGADLSGVDLSGAKYNDNTKWPEGFDSATAGVMIPSASTASSTATLSASTATSTATSTPTSTPTSTATHTATSTATHTATATPTSTATHTATATPTSTATPSPSSTPSCNECTIGTGMLYCRDGTHYPLSQNPCATPVPPTPLTPPTPTTPTATLPSPVLILGTATPVTATPVPTVTPQVTAVTAPVQPAPEQRAGPPPLLLAALWTPLVLVLPYLIAMAFAHLACKRGVHQAPLRYLLAQLPLLGSLLVILFIISSVNPWLLEAPSLWAVAVMLIVLLLEEVGVLLFVITQHREERPPQ